MKWTEEIPTTDGYYWIKCKGIVLGIEEVIDGGTFGEEFGWTELSEDVEFEFYGPLEEPEWY